MIRVSAVGAFGMSKVDFEIRVSACVRVGARDVPRLNFVAFKGGVGEEEALGSVRRRLGCSFRRVVVNAWFHEVAS